MNKSRIFRWEGHVERMEEDRGDFKILTGKHREKKPLESPRRRWEDNVRIDFRKIGVDTKN